MPTAIASVPTIERPGYRASIRRPTLKSSLEMRNAGVRTAGLFIESDSPSGGRPRSGPEARTLCGAKQYEPGAGLLHRGRIGEDGRGRVVGCSGTNAIRGRIVTGWRVAVRRRRLHRGRTRYDSDDGARESPGYSISGRDSFANRQVRRGAVASHADRSLLLALPICRAILVENADQEKDERDKAQHIVERRVLLVD